MPKKKVKHKEHKSTKAKKQEISSVPEVPAPGEAYSDGHPLDVVQYLEAKLILKPEQFNSAQSFRDFGRIVEKTAKRCKVGFIPDPEVNLRPQVREVVFFDTPDFRLYNNAHILRRRIRYVDGFATGDPEIVFKFRHPEETAAAAVDVRPKIDGAFRVKFKAEALPLKHKVGGYRILYSHNCQFGWSQIKDRADSTAMATLSRIFPVLTSLQKSPEDRVTLVNEGIVEEVLLPLGQLDFGKATVAKCDVALWRTRGEHLPLVGEFAFQARFDRAEDVGLKARARVEEFYVALQFEVKDWISLGTTKTGMVYRLKGNAPQSHE
jgi:hypothetical protein